MINANIVDSVVAHAQLFNTASSVAWLDFYFPFFIFFYGLVLHVMLETPQLVKVAQKKMPSQYETFQKHRPIAVCALYVGGLWSLQNIWLS